jgi:hypothetical protein
LRLRDSRGLLSDQFSSSESIRVEMDVDISVLSDALCIGFDLATSDGAVAFRTYQTDSAPDEWPQLVVGRNSLSCQIPAGTLNGGRYVVMPRVSIHCVRWIVNEQYGLEFDVHADHAVSPYAWTPRPGVVSPLLEWRTLDPGVTHGEVEA